MNKIKKYFLALLLLELIFAYAPVYAQTTPQYNSGVDTQIAKYLCTPNSPNVGTNPNGVLFSCINQIYKFAIVVAAVVGVFYIVVAGYIYMSADGSQESVDKAKDMLVSTLTALVILFGGYVILAAINPDLVKFNSIQTPNVTLSIPSTTPPTLGLITGNCNQTFSASGAAGCSPSASNCVDVSSYTSSHNCNSNGGVCLLSPQAAQKAQTLISNFNNSNSGCTISISAAIEGSSGPSVSSCHQNGTCADFNLSPYNTTCAQTFYQAAQKAGAVSLLDEYVAACVAPSTTGGNIHVVF